jgi:adenosylhomocysteine nucleosidase
MREEAKFFHPPPLAHKVHTLLTGVGPKNARAAMQKALEGIRPDLVLSSGFAGGLRLGLPAGTILFSADSSPDVQPTLVELGGLAGRFICSTRIAATTQEKAALRQSSGADAVEMESQAIQEICRARAIRCAVVRVISDAADEDMPLDFNRLMTHELSLHYGKLAWAIASHPFSIRRLIAFQKQTKMAAQSLAAFLQELLQRYRVGSG